jgi:hypothetical protein
MEGWAAFGLSVHVPRRRKEKTNMAKPYLHPDVRDQLHSSLYREASSFLRRVNASQRPQAEGAVPLPSPIFYHSLCSALLDAVEANRPLRAPQRKALYGAAELVARGRGWGKEQLFRMGLDSEKIPDMERLSMQFHPTFACCALEPSWVPDEEDVLRASRAWASKVERVLGGGDPLAAVAKLMELLLEGVGVLCKAERVLVGPSQLPDEQAWKYLFSGLARLARGPKPRKKAERPSPRRGDGEVALRRVLKELGAVFPE